MIIDDAIETVSEYMGTNIVQQIAYVDRQSFVRLCTVRHYGKGGKSKLKKKVETEKWNAWTTERKLKE
jgi:hypothetical protein